MTAWLLFCLLDQGFGDQSPCVHTPSPFDPDGGPPPHSPGPTKLDGHTTPR